MRTVEVVSSHQWLNDIGRNADIELIFIQDSVEKERRLYHSQQHAALITCRIAQWINNGLLT